MKLIKLISIFAFTFVSGVAFAVAPGKIEVGSVSGKVAFVSADGTQKQLIAGDFFQEKTVVSTDKNSTAKIVLGNGTVVVLNPNTTLDVSQFVQNDPAAVEGKPFSSFSSEPEKTSGSKTIIRLNKGSASFRVAKLLSSSTLTVKTRAGDVIVKGTTFSVSDSGSAVVVSVVDGLVSTAPTGRAAISIAGGRSVSIPVSSTGAIGSPSYRGLPPAEKNGILDSVGAAPAPGLEALVSTKIGIDPEIPAYAQGATVDGPNSGLINSAGSLGTDRPE